MLLPMMDRLFQKQDVKENMAEVKETQRVKDLAKKRGNTFSGKKSFRIKK